MLYIKGKKIIVVTAHLCSFQLIHLNFIEIIPLNGNTLLENLKVNLYLKYVQLMVSKLLSLVIKPKNVEAFFSQRI